MPRSLPLGVRYVRTTDVFSPATAPAGLSRAHRVASGVWARLVVSVGHVEFVFEDTPGVRVTVTAGETVAIPPL
ncbi:MAG TPA: DUF1971 domain-containing protein, partial [Ilumatobacteraceae bacterium]|nr:DUF1971 domain-containing protein [Ilumatobacteraceae bacterium]